MSFVDAQKLFIETLARDGEVLIRHITTNNPLDPYRIQFLDADYLDEEENKTLNNGQEIIMGVKLDKYGKPITYYLFKEHPHNKGFNNYDRSHIEVPAQDIIHAFQADRPEQTRGLPFMTTALSRMKMLDGYEEAELVAARVGASKMGFFTSPAGDGYTGEDTMSFKDNFMLPPDKYDKFADNAIFVPRSWGWIDPVKEVKANIDGLNAGVVTMQDVQANYGRDVEELFEQHSREEEIAKLYDVKTAYQPFGAIKMPIDAEIQDDGDEDEQGE